MIGDSTHLWHLLSISPEHAAATVTDIADGIPIICCIYCFVQKNVFYIYIFILLQKSPPPAYRVAVPNHRFLTAVKELKIVLYFRCSSFQVLSCALSLLFSLLYCNKAKLWTLWRAEERCSLSCLSWQGCTALQGSCNSEQYRCHPTFNHNVGCNGTVSVFSLTDSTKKQQINLILQDFINNRFTNQTAPKAHMHILQSSATHLPSLKSIWPTAFALCEGRRDRQTEIPRFYRRTFIRHQGRFV